MQIIWSTSKILRIISLFLAIGGGVILIYFSDDYRSTTGDLLLIGAMLLSIIQVWYEKRKLSIPSKDDDDDEVIQSVINEISALQIVEAAQRIQSYTDWMSQMGTVIIFVLFVMGGRLGLYSDNWSEILFSFSGIILAYFMIDLVNDSKKVSSHLEDTIKPYEDVLEQIFQGSDVTK